LRRTGEVRVDEDRLIFTIRTKLAVIEAERKDHLNETQAAGF
jgi:hypothetical protein